jgi:hypothetical protein
MCLILNCQALLYNTLKYIVSYDGTLLDSSHLLTWGEDRPSMMLGIPVANRLALFPILLWEFFIDIIALRPSSLIY